MRLQYEERKLILKEIQSKDNFAASYLVSSRRSFIENNVNKALTRMKRKISYDEYFCLVKDGTVAMFNSSKSYDDWHSRLHNPNNPIRKRYDESRPIYFIHIGA